MIFKTLLTQSLSDNTKQTSQPFTLTSCAVYFPSAGKASRLSSSLPPAGPEPLAPPVPSVSIPEQRGREEVTRAPALLPLLFLLLFPLPPQSRRRCSPGRRGSMCDPAVCSFLTQTLCAHGGRLRLKQLQENVGLSELQLENTLSAAGPRRFLKVGSGPMILAVSDVRVCVRKVCAGCERLHLCKLHLMGRCNQGPR